MTPGPLLGLVQSTAPSLQPDPGRWHLSELPSEAPQLVSQGGCGLEPDFRVAPEFLPCPILAPCGVITAHRPRTAVHAHAPVPLYITGIFFSKSMLLFPLSQWQRGAHGNERSDRHTVLFNLFTENLPCAKFWVSCRKTAINKTLEQPSLDKPSPARNLNRLRIKTRSEIIPVLSDNSHN